MAIQEITPEFIPGARIKVIWVGGAGCNTINRMIQEGIEWVEFIAVNTDAQALENNLANTKINIGLNLTRWLGAGANPEIGRKAAEENIDEIKRYLDDTDMVFITAGMWGGTWTGAAPVIAQAAKELGILTVGVVTKPFSFEWKRRLENAIEWLEKIKPNVDTLIVIPNDKIFNIIDKKTPFKQAFNMIDRILHLGVQGISDLIVKPGLINIDFADISAIMRDSGTALLGIGYGEGENRTVDATRQAIENPLLEAKLEGAKNIIFAVTGGEDLTPTEVQEAASIIENIAAEDANIIWWMSIDENYDQDVKITIIATGFPETTQTEIIRWASSRQNPIFGWAKKSSANDFVTRTINNSPKKEEIKTEDNSDIPAFLRRKTR
jgi:cell division protein FtsZ